jgi:retron-type reverse transcriptase
MLIENFGRYLLDLSQQRAVYYLRRNYFRHGKKSLGANQHSDSKIGQGHVIRALLPRRSRGEELTNNLALEHADYLNLPKNVVVELA